jgi:hypothetical protein
MTRKTLSLLLLGLALLGQSCHSDPEPIAVDLGEVTKDTTEIAPEILNDLVASIPTPLEMSSALIASGAEYDHALLNPVESVEKYSTAYQKAFNLGVYGADLAYINNYGKTIFSLTYLGSIKRLADDLRIGQFFDLEALQRLSTNSKNTDSLIFISTSNFNAINKHLRANQRSNLSVLMICGAWLEGMHIAGQVYTSSPNEELQRILAEQKIVLDRIAVVVDAYPSDTYFAALHDKLEGVQAQFKKITVESEYHAPTKKVVDGNLVVQDNSVTRFNIPEGVMDSAVAQIADVRKAYVN